jgi:hypothetical protein
VADEPSEWRLTRFEEHLDRWADIDQPDEDDRLVVANWVMTRHDNPYQGARREPVHPNLWFARIPGTVDKDGTIVVCAYYIFEQAKIIRCDSIMRLGLPL